MSYNLTPKTCAICGKRAAALSLAVWFYTPMTLEKAVFGLKPSIYACNPHDSLCVQAATKQGYVLRPDLVPKR